MFVSSINNSVTFGRRMPSLSLRKLGQIVDKGLGYKGSTVSVSANRVTITTPDGRVAPISIYEKSNVSSIVSDFIKMEKAIKKGNVVTSYEPCS